MIKAKHHIVIYPLFKWLTRFLLKRNFCCTHIEGSFTDNGESVLVIANHISWWDGFWVEYMNQKTIHRKFHFMMLEEQLKKHWYFQYTGGYSVKKKSKEILKSIDYSIELLKDNNNLVLMFPQGKIHSAHNSFIHFEKGVQYIIDKCRDNTQILFLGNFTDYFSEAKPHLFIYAKSFSAAYLKEKKIEDEYNLFFTNVLNHHKTKNS